MTIPAWDCWWTLLCIHWWSLGGLSKVGMQKWSKMDLFVRLVQVIPWNPGTTGGESSESTRENKWRKIAVQVIQPLGLSLTFFYCIKKDWTIFKHIHHRFHHLFITFSILQFFRSPLSKLSKPPGNPKYLLRGQQKVILLEIENQQRGNRGGKPPSF